MSVPRVANPGLLYYSSNSHSLSTPDAVAAMQIAASAEWLSFRHSSCRWTVPLTTRGWLIDAELYAVWVGLAKTSPVFLRRSIDSVARPKSPITPLSL